LKKLFKLFLVLLSLFSLVCAVVFIFIIYISINLPKINSLADYKPFLPSKIYSSDGKLLSVWYKENREIVEFDEIPTFIIDAFLAAEDDNFYEHAGIDFLGIARAMIVNVKAGKVVQGGSTITQQVAKSLLLSKERTIARKIKDLLLAYKIEKSFSKKDILYLYLNQIYLGSGFYGIKAAFKGYFGKELNEAPFYFFNFNIFSKK